MRRTRSGIVCRSRTEGEGLNGIPNECEFDRTVETAGHTIEQQPCGAFLIDREPGAFELLVVAAAPPIGSKAGAGERTQMFKGRMLPSLVRKGRRLDLAAFPIGGGNHKRRCGTRTRVFATKAESRPDDKARESHPPHKAFPNFGKDIRFGERSMQCLRKGKQAATRMIKKNLAPGGTRV
jgi:hypothetical protein